MSLIILEGMDGSGKSTLAEQLKKDFGYEIYRSGGPKTAEAMVQMLDDLEILSFIEKTYVVDRTPFISELIYSQAFGRKPVIDAHELVDYWNLSGIKVVYCNIDQEQALANMSREFKAHKPADHTAVVEKQHRLISELYEDLMADMEAQGVDIFEYDWQNLEHYSLLKEWI